MNTNIIKDLYGNINLQKYRWPRDPKIGWWQDRKNLILYHGTHKNNIFRILEEDIIAPISGPTANWVSMALEPYTAFGYASMGGESSFRAAGAKARHVPAQDRIVFVANVPIDWIMKNKEQNFRGNIDRTRTRLTDKTEYENWRGRDHEYYALTELRFPKKFPREFIIGYTRKY